jgi:ADP-ribose pyrophosphatase YjhB (NUDIX family)
VTYISSAEQAVIDAAEHDNKGWVIAASTSGAALDALLAAGLIRLRGRWELTPLGFSRKAKYRAIDARDR